MVQGIKGRRRGNNERVGECKWREMGNDGRVREMKGRRRGKNEKAGE